MRATTIKRWQRGPHDRLYVSTLDGRIQIGWFDLRTRRQQILVPGMMAEFDHAITWWQHLPKGSTPAPNAEATVPQADLAAVAPGTGPRQRADQLRPGPAVRMLARLTGQPTPDQSWTVGAAGETTIGRKLHRLTRHGWRVLHSIDTGAGDIDHLLIGPPGIFVINTKHHPGADVDVSADTITVNRRRTAYAAQVTREAGLARAALATALGRPVYVAPLIVIHGHHSLSGWKAHTPAGVRVLPSWAIRWWARLPGRAIHTPSDIEQIYAAARRASTWRGPAATPATRAPNRGMSRQTRAEIRPPAVMSVSKVAPQWSTAGSTGDGRPWGPLREFPARPADPRTDRWRELILSGDLGDLLGAKQVANELDLPFEEFRQLVIDSEFYWFRHRQGRPALPPPDAPDYHGEPEWFRYALAEHFGAPHTPSELIRSIYADLD